MMLATAPPLPGRDWSEETRKLPAGFAKFSAALPQMAPGAPGKVGVLELRFERRGDRTQLVHAYSTGPQRVNRALYLDEALTDIAFVFIQSVGGGILQGDRLRMALSVGPGARAHVTTQSAIKVYRMEADYATQHVQASVEEGGYLELISDPVIPYRGARFYNVVDFTVAEGATMVYADAIAPGRVAFGESFEYELVHTRLVARRSDGRPRAADTMVLEPGRSPLHRPGLLGGYAHLGSLLVLDDAHSGSALANYLNDGLSQVAGAWGAASALPGGDGAFLRVLGLSSNVVQTALHSSWRAARQSLVGAGLPGTHRIKYGSDLVENIQSLKSRGGRL
ncbi:MAG: urease accessory protein UreD [Actinomycetes bacterium]